MFLLVLINRIQQFSSHYNNEQPIILLYHFITAMINICNIKILSLVVRMKGGVVAKEECEKSYLSPKARQARMLCSYHPTEGRCGFQRDISRLDGRSNILFIVRGSEKPMYFEKSTQPLSSATKFQCKTTTPRTCGVWLKYSEAKPRSI